MKELHFIAKVVSKNTSGYTVEVNKANISNLPIGEVTERIINCTDELVIGSVYYFYKANLDDSKRVQITGWTYLGYINQSNVLVIPDEVKTQILDIHTFPVDIK